MKKIELTYNPFTHERTFLVNGEPDSLPNCWGDDDREELSEWCGDFFEALESKYNTEMEVSFKGILRDWESLADAKEKYHHDNPSDRITLKDSECVNTKAKINELSNLFEKMQSESPFPELNTPELKESFENALSDEFEIAVVAPMSSGKSTLINAMLGCNLLPARNEPTTAAIARIHDIDGMKGFKGKSYDTQRNELSSCDQLTLESMERLNGDSKTSVIEIEGDIVGVESKDVKLVLTDTPGPNNSQTDKHKNLTYKLLNADYKPMLLYVLDSTNLEATDNEELLEDVANAMSLGGRQSQERFLFVLNKADEFDPENGENAQKKQVDAINYLAKHQIKDARVFPTAAKMANIVRRYLSNQTLTKHEKARDLSQCRLYIEDDSMHFSDLALPLLSSVARKKLDAMLDDAKSSNDEYRQALIYTGVPAIELAITEYLEKYALPVKIAKGVESFNIKLEKLGVEAQATKELEGNQERVEELKSNLAKIESELQKGEMSKKVKAKIDAISIQGSIITTLERFRCQLMSDIMPKLQTMQDASLSLGKAMAYQEELQQILSDKVPKFRLDIQKAVGKVFTAQVQESIDIYQEYLQKLFGALPYSPPPAAILGNLADISVEDTLDGYTRKKKVKIGSHKEKSGKGSDTGEKIGEAIGIGLAALPVVGWFFKPIVVEMSTTVGGAIGHALDRKIDVDDYEMQERVNFSKWVEKEFMPAIERFTQQTQNAALAWVRQEEKKFKEHFMSKLDEMNSLMRKKITEKKKAIADKTSLERTIAESKRRLAWLKDFKADLNKVLVV